MSKAIERSATLEPETAAAVERDAEQLIENEMRDLDELLDGLGLPAEAREKIDAHNGVYFSAFRAILTRALGSRR